jgi:hypothetical protein
MSNVTTFTSADIGFLNDQPSLPVTESTNPITLDCTGLRGGGSRAFLVTAISTTTNKRFYAIFNLASGWSSYISIINTIPGTITMTAGGILTFVNSPAEAYILNCLAIC